MTEDIYSDSEPAWNNDGSSLVFVSDRKDDLTGQYEPESIEMETFSQKDLYTIDLKSEKVSRLTATDHNEDYPIWAHTKTNTLFYVSDKGGVWNIYRHNLDAEPVAITNILTGAFQLSLTEDDGYMVFPATPITAGMCIA